MVAASERRKIIVISDNDGLAKVIDMALNKEFTITPVVLSASGPDLAGIGRCQPDLIIVALSSFSSEPVVALSRASLVNRVGRVPVLIISDKPFDSAPDHQITYLEFPFDLDRLCARVHESMGPEPTVSETPQDGSI